MIQCEKAPRANGRWEALLTDPTLGAVRLEIANGGFIHEPPAAAQRLYFIHSGQVRTYEAGPDDSARLLEILGPGDWFGEESLAIAASDTVCSALPVGRLIELLARQPGAALELIRQLATRLQSARQDTNRFVFDDCSARLVKTLLRFSSTAAATPEENGAVTLRITHRQLAEAVGAARETVSLALTQLRQQNLLRTGRNRLMFQPEALQAMAGNGNGNGKGRES